MRKLILQLTMVLVLGLGVSAFGANIYWDGTQTTAWDLAANWSSVVPGSGDYAIVGDGTEDTSLMPLIDSSMSAVCQRGYVGYQSGNSTVYQLNMTGGTLAVGYRLFVGYASNSYGEFNLSGGVATLTDRLMLGHQGNGVANISGGTLTSNANGINMGCSGGASYGELNLSGGTINAPNIWVGDEGTGVLNVTGGELNLSSTLYITKSGDVNGSASLDGGVIEAAALSITNPGDVDGLLDIAGGALVLAGQYDSSWQYYVDGWVTANGGTGTLDFDYDSGSDITTITAIPEPATMGLLALGGLGVLIRRRR